MPKGLLQSYWGILGDPAVGSGKTKQMKRQSMNSKENQSIFQERKYNKSMPLVSVVCKIYQHKNEYGFFFLEDVAVLGEWVKEYKVFES